MWSASLLEVTACWSTLSTLVDATTVTDLRNLHKTKLITFQMHVQVLPLYKTLNFKSFYTLDIQRNGLHLRLIPYLQISTVITLIISGDESFFSSSGDCNYFSCPLTIQ